MRTKPTMKVKPVEGALVSFHDNPRRPITGETTVPVHPHYIRAIKRGDLADCNPPALAPKKMKKKEG